MITHARNVFVASAFRPTLWIQADARLKAGATWIKSESFRGLKSLVGTLLRADEDRHLVGDREAVAFEGDDLARVIGEHAQVLQAEVDQYLRANAAFVL